ncbi:DUF3649 domain-containing protein [Alcaligenes faecalis subsp. parafaecalis]|uniref:DUF3649 domain-containing protein n=2 Tax=Alcaligenes parafaecalis TaxID=171260 RepID=A0ABT3VGU9_9BURK|nr:DUF3649 domain-containing protein [Alcaligenes parafaecalis]
MSQLGLRYRLQVLSRIVAAIIGGYVLTSAITVLLTLIWPLPRSEAVLSANMLSFIWYTVAVIWVFSAGSALRAWAGLLLTSALIALLCLFLAPQGAMS